MKKRYFLHSLICLLAVSCTFQELDVQVPSPMKETAEDDVFYASLESYSTPDTKVYVDEDIQMHWNADDQLSIFDFNTLNQPYHFSGETGAVSGCFTRVSDPVEMENDLDVIYAVYPYRESTSISDEGVLTLTLPAVQTYQENSFGPGANTMVSMTDGHFLKFKNLCGYLVLKFYGAGVSVSSIRLDGLNGEKLSGEATVTHSIENYPQVAMTSNAGTSIILNCETPVELGTDCDHATVFWMVVPPTVFSKGFRLTVTDADGNVFFKETNRQDLSIVRNSVLRISPIEVTMSGTNLSLSSFSPVSDGTLDHTINDPKSFTSEIDETARTVTVTMPTVTSFSNLVFSYTVPEGATVMLDGENLVNGVTSIDASSPVTLTVRNGSFGKNYVLTARNTGLPVVRITTPVDEGITQARIEADDDHETWYDGATIHIENADGSLDLHATTEIKGRGNASWTYDKRPFALRLKSKAKVLGMKKHKRWILLANWKDRTLLRNDAAFWLSKKSGLPYTVNGYFVELEFNGIPRGNYYLCEQIKIDENRVNITKVKDEEVGSTDPYIITGPYLMEIDNNYDEQYKFKSGFYGKTSHNGTFTPYGLKYMFKEPDEDIPIEAQNYMKNLIVNMEALIKKIPDQNYGYRYYLDMDSAIWFMFVNELTGNGDFFNTDSSDQNSQWYGPHSTYLYKDRDKEDGTVSKVFMGPVWDFDYKTFISELTTTSWNGSTQTEQRSTKWVGANSEYYYYYFLCKDPVFRARMLSLWETYKGIITPKAFNDYIDSMEAYLTLSEEINTKMWGVKDGKDQKQNGDYNESFHGAIDLMKTAFAEKRAFMDANLEYLNQ